MKWAVITSLMKKLKNNMLKQILLYFLLAICLLSKDGISVIIDSMQVKQSVFAVLEKSSDNSLEEEDASEDFWQFASTGLEEFSFLTFDFIEQKIPVNLEMNVLQVHLERIIPPPDKA